MSAVFLLLSLLFVAFPASAAEPPSMVPELPASLPNAPLTVVDPDTGAVGSTYVRRARLGNALVPVGLGLSTFSFLGALAARGNDMGLWGTLYFSGLGMSAAGMYGAHVALQRGRYDLAYRGLAYDGGPIGPSLVMGGVGTGLVLAGSVLALADVEGPALMLAPAGAMVMAASVFARGARIQALHRSYTWPRSLMVVPTVDLRDGGYGVSVSGRF